MKTFELMKCLLVSFLFLTQKCLIHYVSFLFIFIYEYTWNFRYIQNNISHFIYPIFIISKNIEQKKYRKTFYTMQKGLQCKNNNFFWKQKMLNHLHILELYIIFSIVNNNKEVSQREIQSNFLSSTKNYLIYHTIAKNIHTKN